MKNLKSFNDIQFNEGVNYEIERRFLLSELPSIQFDTIKMISQYYGVDDIGNFRIRVENDKLNTYYITRKKFISSGINEEDEKVVTLSEFLLKKKETNRMISKKRHIKYVGDSLKWEIDVFSDPQMIVAEIEIPYMDFDLEIPDYIKSVLVEEITDRKDLSNFALSK